jgi:ribosomal protein S1/HrpA-like RNA helicase
MTSTDRPERGASSSLIRTFVCKECQREVEQLQADLAAAGSKNRAKKLRKKLQARQKRAEYNEHWARRQIERGGSRSDRCRDHRTKHQTNIQGLAVAYIDIGTVGEVTDRTNPTGPLGGLGPLPERHEVKEGTSYDLSEVKVGMTDDHIVEMVDRLRASRVLVLKAGTGTGKSTFVPYRLMDPPERSHSDAGAGVPFRKLTDLGRIVVTEPRVQATVGVADFVGRVMSGAGGVGPGYPVGYQVRGDRNHDDACQLVYVTDGTMINWMREGRLSQVGTVIVDEAHERSTNIDFILGYLCRELDKYPHLRVIVTSATFDTAFYREYFGPDVTDVMVVPPVKTFGYGMPLFPGLDAPLEGEEELLTPERWPEPDLPLAMESSLDVDHFVQRHWPQQYGPPLEEGDTTDPDEVGTCEDVWETTSALIDLRYAGYVEIDDWKDRMPDELARYVVELAKGLDEKGIHGDILGFLATRRTIEEVCEKIERELGPVYTGQVFPLVSTLEPDRQKQALTARRKGEPRKIVISTNLAETSLTVEGVRFIVDSGIIAQPEWDPELAKGGVPTKPHSRAGIRQRWGRVGRKGPGWVFPMYTKGQFASLAQDTPPGSTRDNLEQLVMTAKMGGVHDVTTFPWPAAFNPETVELDETARGALSTFRKEIRRADRALCNGGALDREGHPTGFGKELTRFSGLGSTASALAVMYADRLACVPEVATVLALLEDTRLVGQNGLLLDNRDWPEEWRLEAFERHQGLAAVASDDAELVLAVCGAWERADPAVPPWDPSEARQAWARQWWVNDSVLLEGAKQRQEVLSSLSPAMKEEVKRFVSLSLLDRARLAIVRAFADHLYVLGEDDQYRAVATTPPVSGERAERDADAVNGEDSSGSTDVEGAQEDEDGAAGEGSGRTRTTQSETVVATTEDDLLLEERPPRVVALRRRMARDDVRVSSLVLAAPWMDDPTRTDTTDEAMSLVLAATTHARPAPASEVVHAFLETWPVGQRVRLRADRDDEGVLDRVVDLMDPFSQPPPDEGPPRRSRRRGRGRVTSDDAERDNADTAVELTAPYARRDASDEQVEKERAFRQADREIDHVPGCGVCAHCVAGQDDKCESPGTVTEEGKRSDPLQSWLARAAHDAEVRNPPVVLDHRGPNGDSENGLLEGWYEVTSYQRTEDSKLALMLRRDWRPEGFSGNPAAHNNLAAGTPVEVTVGPMLRHHGGQVRSFFRVDQQGRFLLRDAFPRRLRDQVEQREIAVALDPGARGLPALLEEGSSLVATVVPAKVAGCTTITLLELLHQHLQKAKAGLSMEWHSLPGRGRSTNRVKLHSAVVVEPPNEHGWGTAELLLRDPDAGIHHRFQFRGAEEAEPADDDGNAPSNETGEGSGEAPVDGPLLLRLRGEQKRTHLDVSGLPLDELRTVEHESDHRLKLDRVNDEDDDAVGDGNGEDGDDDEHGEVVRLAPDGARLMSRGEEPVSRHAAQALAQLDDDPDWHNDVWAFWARSHHLALNLDEPPLRGTATEPHPVPAELEIREETPLELRRQALQTWATTNPVGTIVDAVVHLVTDGFVRVEIDENLPGKIVRDELSWRYITHPADVVEPGDSIRGLVTKIEEATGHVTLSAKQVEADPFVHFWECTDVGSDVQGTVRTLQEYGAFVEVAPGVEGLVHISELAHEHVDHPSEVLSVEDQVRVRVMSIDADERKLALSIKELQTHPFDAFVARHKIGDNLDGTVTKVVGYGAFVEVAPGVEGLVHISELAHEHVDHPSEVLSVEDQVRVRVMSIDADERKLALSIKELQTHPFDAFVARHKIGDNLDGTVTKVVGYGAFVEVAPGVEGLVHISELANSFVSDPSTVVSEGQEVRVQIIKVVADNRRLSLSIKSAEPAGRRSARSERGASKSGRQSRAAGQSTRKRRERAEGPTVSKATKEAAAQLGLDAKQVRTRTLREPKRGLFGRVKQSALVEVTEV